VDGPEMRRKESRGLKTGNSFSPSEDLLRSPDVRVAF